MGFKCGPGNWPQCRRYALLSILEAAPHSLPVLADRVGGFPIGSTDTKPSRYTIGSDPALWQHSQKQSVFLGSAGIEMCQRQPRHIWWAKRLTQLVWWWHVWSLLWRVAKVSGKVCVARSLLWQVAMVSGIMHACTFGFSDKTFLFGWRTARQAACFEL